MTIPFIDTFLNKITMYRLVLYYLLILLGVSVIFGFFNIIHYNAAHITFSALLIFAACWSTNALFAKIYATTPNTESVYITALILALILTPPGPENYIGVGGIIFVSVWAMASKFIGAFHYKHLFNPAAFGVALGAIAINQPATWWVGGSIPLLPFVFFGGLLIVRKIRRFDVVLSFAIVGLITIALTAPTPHLLTPLTQTLLNSSFFFLAFVMLTEPLTMPPTRTLRILYGTIVGILFAPNMHLGSFYFTPELALLAGNIFAFFVSPKGRPLLTLLEKKEIGADTYEFIFAPDRPLSFRPGQYMEWTLGHRFADDRGNRRYFTIASSPTEPTVHLGVRFYEPESTFKRALKAMKPNNTLSVSNLSGDFVLPKDPSQKLAFIAGGIGVTPFRSMVQYLIDKKEQRSVVLLYSNKTVREISYKDIFDQAAAVIGMKTIYAITDEPADSVPGAHTGFIDAALIQKEIPDYKERLFYLSGPHGMVTAFTKTLRTLGVPHTHIKTDYFPGFA